MCWPRRAITKCSRPTPTSIEVKVAERTWFERRPDRWGLLTAVWNLGWSLRAVRYDLGIDVRGDVLTVLVLALAGIPRRVGWAMGGGAFLLTDVAAWIPGRHEVRSRLALLNRLGITPDESTRVDVHVSDADRIAIARRLAEAWPRRSAAPDRSLCDRDRHRVRPGDGTGSARPPSTSLRVDQRRAGLAARRSVFPTPSPPGRSPRGRERGQALADRLVESPDRAISRKRLAGRGGRGNRRRCRCRASSSLTTGFATGPAA